MTREEIKIDLNKKYDIQIAWTGFHPHCDTFENIALSYLWEKHFLDKRDVLKWLETHELHEHKVDGFGRTIYNVIYA